jgi:hypothetical protein
MPYTFDTTVPIGCIVDIGDAQGCGERVLTPSINSCWDGYAFYTNLVEVGFTQPGGYGFTVADP